MFLTIPFEPPNEHACIALYHAPRNAWWLVMSTHAAEQRNPWEHAIRATGGTLDNPYVAASFVRHPHSWPSLQDHVRKQMSNGFTIVDGGFDHIRASGTRWLCSDPSIWWDMHSASIAQLKIIQTSPKGGEMVLEALARQGRLGSKTGTPGRRGPSVVEHRWREMFPEEMAFADQCLSLGIGPYDALNLWKSSHMQANYQIQSQDFSELLSGPDLR